MDEELYQSISGSMHHFLPIIWDYMNNVGYSKDDFINEINSKLKKLAEDKKREKQELIEKINEYGPEIFRLEESLKIQHSSSLPEGDLKLFQVKTLLEKKYNELMGKIKERREELSCLKEKELKLCGMLGEEPFLCPNDDVPSEDTISHVNKYIKTLEGIKKQREKSVNKMAISILDLMKELDCKPCNTLQDDIFYERKSLIELHISTLQEMEELFNVLSFQLEEKRELEKELKEKIIVLWDRLNIDEVHRNCILASCTGKVNQNVSVLEDELKELEAMKKAHLSEFVNNLKIELELLWDKCYIGENEKKHCHYFFESEVSEEALQALEEETRRLKEYYEANNEMFTKFNSLQETWAKVMELKNRELIRSNDPKLRYANRGGSLLQEERERNRINARLPRFQNELQLLAENYKLVHGKEFYVFDQTLQNFIMAQKDDFEEQKKGEKVNRHAQKIEELHIEARFGTSKQNSKRINLRSDNLPHSKFQKLGESQRCPGNSRIHRTFSRNNLATHPPPNVRVNDNRGILRDHGNICPDATLDSSNMPTYSKFSENLSKSQGDCKKLSSSRFRILK